MEIKRCYETIIGASVAENQIVQNGNFADGTSSWSTRYTTISANNGIATFTPTSDGTARGIVQTGNPNAVISNRKYLLSAVINPSVAMAFSLSFGGASGKATAILPANTWTRAGTIWTYAEPTFNCNIAVYSNGTMTTEQTAQVRNVYAIDLTAMFGTTIADYAYTLEQATAGSGIAWLRSYGFLGGYVPYNAGSIESVEVTEKKCVGFNQWDEEWEVGGISYTTGEKDTATSRIRSKNYIPVIGAKTYFVKDFGIIACFDADKNYLGNVSYTTVSGGYLLNLSADTRYILFSTLSSYGTTYKNDICINLSSDRNGEHEPYTTISYPLGTDTLRGIFKLDANNKLYADGDRKESDGTITRKYGVVDLGTLNWTFVSASEWNCFSEKIADKKPGLANVICARYAYGIVYRTDTNMIVCGNESNGNIYIRDTAYADSATFKSAMSGVMLVYELATPTTEQSTPFPSPQVCYPDGTEEYVTSNGVPVGHVTRYEL